MPSKLILHKFIIDDNDDDDNDKDENDIVLDPNYWLCSMVVSSNGTRCPIILKGYVLDLNADIAIFHYVVTAY